MIQTIVRSNLHEHRKLAISVTGVICCGILLFCGPYAVSQEFSGGHSALEQARISPTAVVNGVSFIPNQQSIVESDGYNFKTGMIFQKFTLVINVT